MRIAFPTDEHHPYADENARQLALTIVRDFDPEIRIAGSDALDFYSLSKFDKNPRRRKTLDFEVNAWVHSQREWQDAAPNAIAVWLMGNHEFRL